MQGNGDNRTKLLLKIIKDFKNDLRKEGKLYHFSWSICNRYIYLYGEVEDWEDGEYRTFFEEIEMDGDSLNPLGIWENH